MAYVTGLLVIDAPASALNNAGPDAGARIDNSSAIKFVRTPQGSYPYVSAQAVRYWLRESIAKRGGPWVASPTYKESANLAYTSADPIAWWDDDLFGYMRAPDAGTKEERKKDPTFQRLTPLEEVKNRSGKLSEVTITRISPLRIGTMVSIAPVWITNDFGSMARHEGDPVLHGHQFYRAHLRCLFSLDLTGAGTFFDANKVGIKNLDSIRRKKAEDAGLAQTEVRGQTAFRLPIEKRQERVATLIRALATLDGGAKLTLHYTDVAPSMIFAAVTQSGNHPFARVLTASDKHETELHVDAVKEMLDAYKVDFLSKIRVGWAKGFLDDQRKRLPEAEPLLPPVHPRNAIEELAKELESKDHQSWYA